MVTTKAKPKAKGKAKPLITYSDAIKGRKKVEKSAKPEKVALAFTEEMLTGLVEYGVVLDGFSSGVIKELILAWDAAGLITSAHGKKIARRIREGKTTKRKSAIEKKKRR